MNYIIPSTAKNHSKHQANKSPQKLQGNCWEFHHRSKKQKPTAVIHHKHAEIRQYERTKHWLYDKSPESRKYQKSTKSPLLGQQTSKVSGSTLGKNRVYGIDNFSRKIYIFRTWMKRKYKKIQFLTDLNAGHLRGLIQEPPEYRGNVQKRAVNIYLSSQ
jgi:hypothetical protein